MRKQIVLSLLLLSLPLDAALALRCGSRVISTGDHYTRVLRFCGEPIHVNQWVETRVQRVYEDPWDDYRNYGGVKPGKTYGPQIVKKPVVIEEWTYNLGPQRFMRLLRFEDGRLENIETLEYGY